ncbi:MAG: inorganic phosphate transporter [Euryarchaeota archaeon]|nr:inorganic phosphate transporter [Euryarchaeota archaeon]
MEGLTMVVVALALSFDFVNGFHDAANAIATIVATKVLTPLQAVTMSAAGNFTGMLFGTVIGVLIAKTIGKGIIDTNLTDGWTGVWLIMAVLIGAIGWDLITWWLGLPTSSSHALVGGLVGAGLALAGTNAILGPDPVYVLDFLFYTAIGGAAGALVGGALSARGGLRRLARGAALGFAGGAVIAGAAAGWYFQKHLLGLVTTVIFMVFSPLIGLGFAFLITSATMRALRRRKARVVNWWFRKLQLVSSFFYSVMHGTSDAQKVMGIITMVLVFDGTLSTFEVPFWVVFACHASISLGTFFGGWRIVKTMASRITSLQPYQGFCAETGGGLVLVMNAVFGIPVSTTHVISSSIMGVGATRRLSAVRWGVARSVIWAWILTIPMSALLSFVAFAVIRLAGLA